MVGAIQWDSLTHAAAFLIGAVFAVIGTLRVVRAVIGLVTADPAAARRHRSHPPHTLGGGRPGDRDELNPPDSRGSE
jgi:hypothetical protein